MDKATLHEQLMAKEAQLRQLLSPEVRCMLEGQVATDAILCELRDKLKLLESQKYDPNSETDKRIREVRAYGYRATVGRSADLKALQRMVDAGIVSPDAVDKAKQALGVTGSQYEAVKEELKPLLRQRYRERREKAQALRDQIKAREKELRGVASADRIRQLQDDIEQIQRQLYPAAEDNS